MHTTTPFTPTVSAIVSTYASERFIRGCLDDLIAQTLFAQGALEIIVIDACSPQKDGAIAREYQKKYGDAIVYERTSEREGVYASWNRAIRRARGELITNANTDDRRRHDAMEIMASVLARRPEIDVVYGDCYITETENETFEQHHLAGTCVFPEYSRGMLAVGCFMGPQPMWRKSLHDRYGFFDEQFVSSGDWEFWLRIAESARFLHIRDFLGLYLRSPMSIEHRNHDIRTNEDNAIVERYLAKYLESRLDVQGALGSIQRWKANNPARTGFAEHTKALLDLRNRRACEEPPHARLSIVVTGPSGMFERNLALALAYKREFVDVEVIELPSHSGVTSVECANEGVCRSAGDHVAILSNADEYTPSLFHRLSDILDANPALAAVAPLPIGSREDFADITSLTEIQRMMLAEVRTVDDSCLVLRRSVMDEIGVFDERMLTMRNAVEDFSLRAALAHHPVVLSGDGAVLTLHAARDAEEQRAGHDALVKKWSGIDAHTPLGHDVFVFNVLARVRDIEEADDHELAIRMLDEALKGDPHFAPFHIRRAWHLVRAARWDELTAVINAASDEIKRDPQWLDIAGYCAEHSDDDAIAEQCAARSESLQPESSHPFIIRGHLALKRGDAPGAELAYREGSHRRVGRGEALGHLGALVWSLGRQDEGYQLLEQAVSAAPNDSLILEACAEAATALHRCQDAADLFRRGARLYPGQRTLVRMQVRMLAEAGSPHNALRVLLGLLQAGRGDASDLDLALNLRRDVGPQGNGHANTLSLCMIVKNEERNLPLCLASAAPLVDEMIIVDTGSSDHTREIATAFGARVVTQQWDQDFSAARNRAIEEASGGWILSLDADETIAPRDAETIRAMCRLGTPPRGYLFTTRNYVHAPDMIGWRRNDGVYAEEAGTGWVPSEKVRLFPRRPDVRFANRVHEAVEASLERSGILILRVEVPIHHYGKLNSDRTREKAENYLQLGRLKLAESGGDDPKALYELAVQEQELGNTREAIALWERLRAVQPDAIPASAGLGICLHRLGEYTRALDFLTAAGEAIPGLREVQVLRGLTLMHLQRPAEAVAHLRTMVRQDSEYPMYRVALGLAHICAGSVSEAASAFAACERKRIDASAFIKDYAKKFEREDLVTYVTAIRAYLFAGKESDHITAMSHA